MDVAEPDEPVWDARSLESSPIELELVGAPSTLEYPALCAHCAAQAGRRVLIERVFRRWRKDEPWLYLVAGARIPFCDGCIAQHKRDRPPISLVRRVLLCFRAGIMVAAVRSGALAIFFATEALAVIGERDSSCGRPKVAGFRLGSHSLGRNDKPLFNAFRTPDTSGTRASNGKVTLVNHSSLLPFSRAACASALQWCACAGHSRTTNVECLKP